MTLQNTAYSVNIKERLDFSCAVFDAQGALVANAPHMPVHLGSMDASVATVIRENADVRPGDMFLLNAPYNGGTHLPDLTVCTPVFDSDVVRFWVASRGHHADIGGIAPRINVASGPPSRWRVRAGDGSGLSDRSQDYRRQTKTSRDGGFHWNVSATG